MSSPGPSPPIDALHAGNIQGVVSAAAGAFDYA
jgi:hypothetical protein